MPVNQQYQKPTNQHEFLAWDVDMLRRYDTRGPRYTSYPGAHLFNNDFDVDCYEQVLTNEACSSAPLSLYVHIPFCENICYYCACNKIVTRDRQKAKTYMRYLEQEIGLLSSYVSAQRQVRSLHFGGGTPTFLQAGQLTELMYTLAGHFRFADADDREFSIELDPRTVDDSTLALLKGLGFNRLSFGVQDFDADVQKAINRVQSVQQVECLTESARDYGFDSISYDLIYGLPCQSVDTMTATLAEVIRLKPDRIALYNYAHLPELFSSQRSIHRMQLPQADEKLAMLVYAANTLQQNGYRYVGMDHFVREDDELSRALDDGRLSRNFQGYSVSYAPDTLALGVSGISAIGRSYAQNHKTLDGYYAALEAGRLPIAKGLSLKRDDLIRREVINRIICRLKLDISAIETQFSIDFNDYFGASYPGLKQAQCDGLLDLSDQLIAVTPKGRLFLRNICMLFDAYLQPSEQRFSRTL